MTYLDSTTEEKTPIFNKLNFGKLVVEKGEGRLHEAWPLICVQLDFASTDPTDKDAEHNKLYYFNGRGKGFQLRWRERPKTDDDLASNIVDPANESPPSVANGPSNHDQPLHAEQAANVGSAAAAASAMAGDDIQPTS